MIQLFANNELTTSLSALAVSLVAIGVVALLAGVIAAPYLRQQHWPIRPILNGVIAVVFITTSTLLWSSLYVTSQSSSRGHVNWQSQIEFWICGSELELREPWEPLRRAIGSTTQFELNDKTMHVRGLINDPEIDASLTGFMRAIDGFIQPDAVAIPLSADSDAWLTSPERSDGDLQKALPMNYLNAFVRPSVDTGLPVASFTNGQRCDDGSPAELQTFVYRFDEQTQTYRQHKLEDPSDYTVGRHSSVLPGDCVIIEFDAPKGRTTRLCAGYGERDSRRCQEFRPGTNPSDCNITEVIELRSEP